MPRAPRSAKSGKMDIGNPSSAEYHFKTEDETVELEAEIEAAEPTSTGPASFNGKLKISDYAFSSDPKIKTESSTPPRRSTRSLTREASHEVQMARAPILKRKGSIPSRRSSASPSKRSRKLSGYAPPSKYAHLKPLPDVLAPNLLSIFVGLNPGIQTSVQGHAYAHPSNLFWKLLHSSGLTTRRCQPSEDQNLPRLFCLGNTNIVSRPTRNGSELSKGEMDESVWVLEEKIRKWKPESVCIVGKSIWESIWRARHGRAIKKEEFKYGWQNESENMGLGGSLRTGDIKPEAGDEGFLDIDATGNSWNGARVFVATSTSGLAATLSLAEKETIWRELGAWVEKRRKERAFIVDVKEEAV